MFLNRYVVPFCLAVVVGGCAVAPSNIGNGEGFFLQSIVKDGKIVREIEYDKSFSCSKILKEGASYAEKNGLLLHCSITSRKNELGFVTSADYYGKEYRMHFNTLEYCNRYVAEKKKNAEDAGQEISIDPCKKNENYIDK